MSCWVGRGAGSQAGGAASPEVCSFPQQLSSCLVILLFTSGSRSPCCCCLLRTVCENQVCSQLPHSRFRVWFPAPAKMPPVHLLSNLQDAILIPCCIHPALVSLSSILNLFTVVFTGFQKGAKLDKCVQSAISSGELYCGFL